MPKPLLALLAATLVVLTALPNAPAAAANAQGGSPREDPFDMVNHVTLEGAKIVESSVERLNPKASTVGPVEKKPLEDAVKPRPVGKIHPALERRLATGDPDERVEIVITYADSLQIPRFPVPDLDSGRDSRTNRRALVEAERLIRELTAARAEGYKRATAELQQLGGAVRKTFWLINGVVVELPLGAVKELAERRDVQYLEPVQTDDKPPADSNADNDVEDGRGRITSDPYFNLGQAGGWIGLLDTGVRDSHTLFASPDHIAIQEDMTGGGNTDDTCWNHGTKSAAIITGNGGLGSEFRGVSGITLDNLKVYSGCNGLDSAAAVDGFQRAVAILDRVIVAEMQGSGAETSAIPTAADNAFDAGAVIIAANGNFGPGAGSVRAPANAHKVLGVGAYDVESQTLNNSSGRGPTADGRYKPDVTAPTNTETASTSGSTDTATFGGTSGATPYAAGAAALMRNWQRHGTGSIDPGQVYAHLILSGQRPYPFNNDTGAGTLVLPTGGHAWWGKVSVEQGETIDIPIPVAAGKTRFEGALWWPEGQSGHSDVDLRLVDPGGRTRDLSISIPSVFERTRVDRVSTGTWKLRISGYSVRGSQTVYWGARTR